MGVSWTESKLGSGRESGWGIVVRQPGWVVVDVCFGVEWGFGRRAIHIIGRPDR